MIVAWSHVFLTGVGFGDVLHPKRTPRVPWVLPHPPCSSTEELSRQNYPTPLSKQTNKLVAGFISGMDNMSNSAGVLLEVFCVREVFLLKHRSKNDLTKREVWSLWNYI